VGTPLGEHGSGGGYEGPRRDLDHLHTCTHVVHQLSPPRNSCAYRVAFCRIDDEADTTAGEVHPATEYFWQGTRLGELRVLRCTACGQLVHPPRPACRRCLHDELVATALCGLGVVY